LKRLDGVSEILAFQLRTLQLDGDLLKGVDLQEGNIGVGPRDIVLRGNIVRSGFSTAPSQW
jgi:hypothetical protein